MIGIMRNSQGPRADGKRKSRERILEAAARRLCAQGLAGAAIAPIMHDAGLTHGSFYSHFLDKDDLARAAFSHAVINRTRRLIGKAADASWSDRLKRIARRYLSPAHRDAPAEGCAFAALTSEAVRAPAAFRKTYEIQLKDMLAAITQPFEADENTDAAIVMMALCIGGMAMSRAVADPDFSDRILLVCANAFADDQPVGWRPIFQKGRK